MQERHASKRCLYVKSEGKRFKLSAISSDLMKKAVEIINRAQSSKNLEKLVKKLFNFLEPMLTKDEIISICKAAERPSEQMDIIGIRFNRTYYASTARGIFEPVKNILLHSHIQEDALNAITSFKDYEEALSKLAVILDGMVYNREIFGLGLQEAKSSNASRSWARSPITDWSEFMEGDEILYESYRKQVNTPEDLKKIKKALGKRRETLKLFSISLSVKAFNFMEKGADNFLRSDQAKHLVPSSVEVAIAGNRGFRSSPYANSVSLPMDIPNFSVKLPQHYVQSTRPCGALCIVDAGIVVVIHPAALKQMSYANAVKNQCNTTSVNQFEIVAIGTYHGETDTIPSKTVILQ